MDPVRRSSADEGLEPLQIVDERARLLGRLREELAQLRVGGASGQFRECPARQPERRLHLFGPERAAAAGVAGDALPDAARAERLAADFAGEGGGREDHRPSAAAQRTTMGPATAAAFAAPQSSWTRASENSSAVPGPRLVISRPSFTTRSSRYFSPANSRSMPGKLVIWAPWITPAALRASGAAQMAPTTLSRARASLISRCASAWLASVRALLVPPGRTSASWSAAFTSAKRRSVPIRIPCAPFTTAPSGLATVTSRSARRRTSIKVTASISSNPSATRTRTRFRCSFMSALLVNDASRPARAQECATPPLHSRWTSCAQRRADSRAFFFRIGESFQHVGFPVQLRAASRRAEERQVAVAPRLAR